jgi:hypothetical protein
MIAQPASRVINAVPEQVGIGYHAHGSGAQQIKIARELA